MAKIASGSELARPSQMQKTPPRVWTIQRTHSRPLMPNFLAAKSEANPPKGRAAKLAMPKLAAMIPAVCSFRLNLIKVHKILVVEFMKQQMDIRYIEDKGLRIEQTCQKSILQ